MFPGSSRPPCTQTAALCASQRRVLLLFHAVFLICQNILSVFSVAVKRKGFIFLIGEAGVPFCLPKKEPKRHQGASFDEHPACAGVHRRRPLDPRLRGTPSWKMGTCVRRLRRQDLASFLPRGHRPLQSKNLEMSALYEHRLVWQSCGSRAVVAGGWGHPPLPKRLSILRVGADVSSARWLRSMFVSRRRGGDQPPDHRRTKQVGRHQAVWVRAACLPILVEPGPSGPGREAKSTQLLPAENNWRTEVARPRKMGGPGVATWNARSAWRSSEPHSLVPFWFLFGQAKRNIRLPRPAGRNPPNKNVGATQNVTPTKNLSYGHRGKAKLCTKLFCLLFSRKK